MKNKKGTIFDIIFITMFVALLFLGIVVLYFVYEQTSTSFESISINNTGFNSAKTEFTENTDKFPLIMDWTGALVIFGVWFTILILSYLLNNNPIFAWIFLIIGIFIIGISIFIANAIYSVLTIDTFLPFYESFPILSFVLEHYLLFEILFVCSGTIALYMKPGGQ